MYKKTKKNKTKENVMKENRRSLKRLLNWIADHHDDWEHICDPEFFTLTVVEKKELIERLEQAGLITVAYVVLYSVGDRSREMEIVRDQIIHRILADTPTDVVMREIKKNLKESNS